ncbi:sugar ABC transporter permease [Cypionkella aquatica]|uniref:Xylose transport system permease protein XylH n=1 Tax=Cypionkella aquatica TaxID=1756042 RepID=A0AA37TWD6_9RHOB|nr:sugar ABC transporter permease [Cypionkella aquatica]GLS87053.1 sugar ABC transporter permease [Cypionkella aquatica]
MTDTPTHAPQSTDAQPGPIARFIRDTELDTRMLGMVGALLMIWCVFHFYPIIANLLSGNGLNFGLGLFITPRNLWNLSVQTSMTGIMATGMVLVIITRNIDLSVGAIVGVTGMAMGIMQVNVLPPILGLGNPMIWIVSVLVGLILGALIGAFHGWLIAYRGIPSFIVTLGGMLVWRGFAFLSADGKTIAPMDTTFALLGGGPTGSVGAVGSWIVGALGCIAVLWILSAGRKSRRKHGFPLRPNWAETVLALLGCGAVIGSVLVVNAYTWPKGIVDAYVKANPDVVVPEGGLEISTGFAIPVLILIVVGILMTILMTRTRFGRYVFAIGGNPEAAALAGINTKWMTLKIFALMGMLAGLAAVISAARLNAATNALGTLDELYVIASAVVGGTSLAGGVGTIYGAIIGALVMQSLQTGMVLIGYGDGSYRMIAVGVALVLAVYLDNLYRQKTK